VPANTARSIANGLSRLRLALTPALLGMAWFQLRGAYFWTLLFALATDTVDGRIARRFDQASAEGAQLDSRADLAIMVTVPFGIWLLFPEAVRRHQRLVVLVVAVHVLTYAVGLVKWGRIPSYHTWGTKTTSVLLAVTVLLLFWVERIEWLLYPAAAVAVCSCVDEVLVTLTLERWQTDVPSCWHARRRMLVTHD
jgi:cardiolipin synthase